MLYCCTGQLKWKENLVQKASDAFLRRQKASPNLRKLVYGNGEPSLVTLCFVSEITTPKLLDEPCWHIYDDDDDDDDDDESYLYSAIN